MKAIVFGGSGFLGSHVADTLTEDGYDVVIYDLKPSRYIKSNQRMIIGDILDEDKVKDSVKGCDYIYHFAGIADLDDAGTRSLETIVQNVQGTVVLLEAAKTAKAKRFIFASTVYVYSDKGGFYRCSKQSAELYIEEYQRRYGLGYTILRYGTVYGPRADRRNSVYRYLRDGLSKKKIVCPAHGEEMREYVHVRDAARLSADILSDKHENKYIIITGHHPMKFKEFLFTIREIMGDGIEIEFGTPNTAHYNLTPYSFTPKVGYKLTSDCYVDLGQGLLECINEIHSSSHTVEERVK
ncbi:MAG: NAD-dependent epimerase [Omnitrophica bacterium RIFCSPLOWO2_01_FULL_45_10]|nr:MAG: NAD-dependent epimerase [Omnitrophica bacterium RIFCSPLOWO2_01_FULL_45_10]